ncbi:hypothetical protein GCM10020369_43450 [Cryptosporangium minutisporangium]|uniref:CsbD-like domain-containing protein n=2 Tax=Cryptosporangium minutisporangium TaxID=113569 RepID=A0ABP6T2T2_9ACTN
MSRVSPRTSDATHGGRADERTNAMGADDKISNKAEEVSGKVKEGAGKATGDKDLEAEGQGDQAGANVKQAGEKIKDMFKS